MNGIDYDYIDLRRHLSTWKQKSPICTLGHCGLEIMPGSLYGFEFIPDWAVWFRNHTGRYTGGRSNRSRLITWDFSKRW